MDWKAKLQYVLHIGTNFNGASNASIKLIQAIVIEITRQMALINLHLTKKSTKFVYHDQLFLIIYVHASLNLYFSVAHNCNCDIISVYKSCHPDTRG